ncbi:serine hydrolase [Altererythrobacter aquiaggeris]|uniref:serine hydrolase domain-containing protein n=1 Tax=Aestuarierythrobacter aquiaggeris TaxID=1898396 RepID=UPI00301939C5
MKAHLLGLAGLMTSGLITSGVLLACVPAQAQQGATSADETDPAMLDWMDGSPPPKDKLVRHGDGSYYTFPRTRWAFSNMRSLFPTINLWRGEAPASVLPVKLRDDLAAVTFLPLGSDNAANNNGAVNNTMRWDEALQASYADAVVVLHRGAIVYERYSGVTARHTPHMSFSMTKSYYGTLAAMLVAEGALDEDQVIGHYIPELADSGFGDATVRQVLDMTTSIQYSEDYTDPAADVFAFALAGEIFPRPQGYQGPDGFYAYLPTLNKLGRHGTRFAYKSVNTEVLGWLIGRVTGRNPVEVLQQRIWGKLGAEEDAYILVDGHGTGWAAGGMNATARDHARFGEMMRMGGRFNRQQIVPEAVVDRISRGGSTSDFAGAGYTTLPGWSYRDQWWVDHGSGVFAARGVHGQTIYIDSASEMVIVRLASHPMAANANIDPVSLPAYRAIAHRLQHDQHTE